MASTIASGTTKRAAESEPEGESVAKRAKKTDDDKKATCRVPSLQQLMIEECVRVASVSGGVPIELVVDTLAEYERGVAALAKRGLDVRIGRVVDELEPFLTQFGDGKHSPVNLIKSVPEAEKRLHEFVCQHVTACDTGPFLTMCDHDRVLVDSKSRNTAEAAFALHIREHKTSDSFGTFLIRSYFVSQAGEPLASECRNISVMPICDWEFLPRDHALHGHDSLGDALDLLGATFYW